MFETRQLGSDLHQFEIGNCQFESGAVRAIQCVYTVTSHSRARQLKISLSARITIVISVIQYTARLVF